MIGWISQRSQFPRRTGSRSRDSPDSIFLGRLNCRPRLTPSVVQFRWPETNSDLDFPAFSVPKADWVSEQGLSRFDISRQAELSAEVDSLGCSISLAGDQFSEFTTRQINWEHHSLLKIASRTPLNIQGFIEIVFQLGHLMSLLTWQIGRAHV